MAGRPVLIRADAGVEIGTGHVMRDLVLAQALAREGVSTVWLCRALPDPVEALLRDQGFRILPMGADRGAPETDAIIAAAEQINARAVVVDHYGIDAAAEARVRAAGFPLLAVDDVYAQHDCDLVLNQNLYASREAYAGRIPEDCRVLGGWRYALLRDEFGALPRRDRRPPAPGEARVLVTLGGADHPNVTARVLAALERVAAAVRRVDLVVGSSNIHRDALEAAAAASPLDVAILTDVRDMARRMDAADLAVTAGGTTHLELVAAGLPALMVTIADNQARVTEHMGRCGLAVDLGWYEALREEAVAEAAEALLSDPDRYREMHARLAAHGPAGGAHRVALAILGLGLRDFALRPMGLEDLMDAFHLSNEPSVRARSFGTEPIPLEEHRRWFTARVADPEGFFYAVRHPDGGFIGQVRLDREEPGARRWTVSLALAPEARGHALGTLVVRRALREALRGSGPHRVDALVRSGNPASLRSFLDAGFVDEGEETIRGSRANRLVFRGE